MNGDSDFTKRKLRGGRFTGETDPLMHKFNRSIDTWGRQMYKADIKQSLAYSKALQIAGILTEHELGEMQRGLRAVEQEWVVGKIQADDEDIFTANERRLSEIVGADIGGKLHTGRSRNDQTTTDARLWLLEEVEHVEKFLKSLIETMATRAEAEVDVLMPGYTHLQRAQPIRWSHFLLSHAYAFLADYERLVAIIPRISVLPLGAGALAGNPYSLDRALLAKELGFRSIGRNSMHMVTDRDYIVEFLQWATLFMMHMSRFAEDLIVYSSAEFGFVQLSDAYSTGSSIMPQKKNPDSLEIIRGKSGRILGQMTGVIVSLKSLPSTYNKDMAEDKEPLFDAVATVQDVVRIAEGVVATLTPEKMRAALTMDMLATDLADYLVRKGVPFRKTHHISGRAVALAENLGVTLADLSLEQFAELSEHFTADVSEVFNFENSVEKRNCIGGPFRAGIQGQVHHIRAALA